MNWLIYKYPLQITDINAVRLPYEHELLSVQMINDKLFLYAMVNIDSYETNINIRIIGTGNPIEEKHLLKKYIGTVQHIFLGKTFVWHVFKEETI